MTTPERPLLAEVKDEIGSLAADLAEMAVLRWKLAKTEFGTDLRAISRLAVALLLVAVMVFSAVPILLVAASGLLSGWLGIPQIAWLLIFGLGLFAGGAATGWLAWCRFRRRFAGMEETLEELREDVVWLREWVGENAPPEGRRADGR